MCKLYKIQVNGEESERCTLKKEVLKLIHSSSIRLFSNDEINYHYIIRIFFKCCDQILYKNVKQNAAKHGYSEHTYIKLKRSGFHFS